VRGAARPRVRLAGHGEPRLFARGRHVRGDHRETAGAEDRVRGGGRIPHGVHRRDPARSHRGVDEEQRVRPVSAPTAQGENAPLKIEGPITETVGGPRIMRHKKILATLAVLGALLSACGGGGSSSASPTPTPTPTPQAETLVWEAPQYFADNTPLNPTRDLQRIEIYVKEEASFGPGDIVIATAMPVDNAFNFVTLDPPLSKGVTYYVSVRAITTEGAKSDFSDVFSFSFQ